MVRTTFVDDNGMRKGAWIKEEDEKLRAFIQRYGHRNWRLLPGYAGLARSGKSCRLRWMNYLKPGLKRGNFSQHEHDLVLKLHASLGKKWSAMALELPGRTDNEIKNYWHGHIAKRSRKGNQAAKSFLNEEQAFKSYLFVLESSQVPCESNITTSQHEETVSPESVKETEISTAEDETWSFWTKSFTFDTDNCGEKPDAMDFWPELPPLDTDIYGQFNHPPPFLQEEDLLFSNVHYDDHFSSFNHATSLLYYA